MTIGHYTQRRDAHDNAICATFHIAICVHWAYNEYRNQEKWGDNLKVRVRKRTKPRRRKPTGFSERMKDLAVDILSGLVSGLLTAAILKLLGW